MNQAGVRVPKGAVATTAAQAGEIYDSDVLGDGPGGKPTGDVVIKAQVLAGGRGKGRFTNGFQGGVHVCTHQGEAEKYAKAMLGESLITKQTGPEGKQVNHVFLMERLYMRREMYFSILFDRGAQGPVMVGSPKGGMSIEDVAEETPELIFTEPIDIMKGIQREQAEQMAKNLGLDHPDTIEDAANVIESLYNMFIEKDATLIEINPLAETSDGKIYVSDAKLNFDDNAEFRQPEVFARRDKSQEDPREVEASEYDLNYIGLDGSIGCMVNGAGLAMSTMDIISIHGGTPANFLDVGGGASAGQVQKAFEILNADEKVHAILVNIFGGIMRCDVIAQGMISAAQAIGLKKPVICRLQGTNVDQAKALVEGSGFRMIMADDLDDAAMKAVKIAEISKAASEIQVGVSFELPL